MLSPRQLRAKMAASAYFRGPSISAMDVGIPTEPLSKNVVGFGVGAKIVDGTVLPGESTVRVYVRELLPEQVFPEQFGGLPTDVVAIGKLFAYQMHNLHEPTPCGVSVGHPDGTTGTLGCLVEREGNHYILSNNHVLAAANAAEPGDIVLQPGPADGGMLPNDGIATLEPYQEIDFSGGSNDIDAAIALVGDCNQTVVSPEIIDTGSPTATPQTATEGQTVRKYGRTTGHTTGVVSDISGDFWVHYTEGAQVLRAWFENQIVVKSNGSGLFSQRGDSGSLIVDAETRDPVALLFAGSEDGEITVANPINLVLQHYDVTVVG